ncbi:hypothetical protein J7J23_00755 [bacterium]|nr:hypothetical protein [bacterium]
MSTGYDNITNNRFAQLARMNEVIFHISDLANLWQIQNKNTLYTTLKRYVQKGLLFRIYRGFYSLKKIEQIEPALLGIKALNRFAYLSTETVLVKAGIISQVSHRITLVSSVSKRFSIGGNFYLVRKLDDRFLFNPIGLRIEGGFYQAAVERAAADLLYFNPHYFFDARQLLDWEKVKKIQEELGYPILRLK